MDGAEQENLDGDMSEIEEHGLVWESEIASQDKAVKGCLFIVTIPGERDLPYCMQRTVGIAIGLLSGIKTDDPKKLYIGAPYPDVAKGITYPHDSWPTMDQGMKEFRLDYLAEDSVTSPRNRDQILSLVSYVKTQGAQLHPPATDSLNVIMLGHLEGVVVEKFNYIRAEQKKYVAGWQRIGKGKAAEASMDDGDGDDDDPVREDITAQMQLSRARGMRQLRDPLSSFDSPVGFKGC